MQFLELYTPVQQQISNYCRALTGNEDMARDLLQDALLAALDGFEGLRKKESFLFFLCGIARRIYLKQIRRNKFRADNSLIDANKHITSELDGETSIDIQLLYKALSQLPIEQREALVFFELMGFSLIEIQSFQGGSLSGVKSRIVRARQKLADTLTDQESKKPEHSTIKKIEI
jgi:RNA polymerase sigma-70 factor (ECF subfamily)